MKLLLTSAGLSTENIENEFKSLLTKPVEECKALIIGVDPGAQDFDMDAYIDRNIKMLAKQGLKKKNISSFKLDSPNPPSLDDIDILYVLGGNEYRHMYWIRKHDLMPEIRKHIENDGVYVARSAGAIIMSPTIEIKDWSMFQNDVGLEDTSGFGYVDWILVPHIDWRKNIGEVVEFHKKTNHKMIYITDKQAVLVRDDTYKII
jgi:dipeptidase E